ncbi:MAG: LysR family transcriptional regulator [Lachnospiraceae bacterium]|nr:LysR family transcriptional regulator [Lachnospiraceae bacterium]
MNNKDARLFLAIAEEQSVTRAAKQIGYTESGASHIIKKLEKEMGFPLFTRTSRGLILTPNGERMLPHVRRIARAHELFIEEASAIRGGQEGHLVVGSYTSTALHWLPATLERFHADYPNITVGIREGQFYDLETWLKDGSIDFGITGQDPSSRTDWIPLKSDSYVAVCSRASSFASRTSFDLKDLENTDCILMGYGIDRDLYACLQPRGIHPRLLFSADNEFTILAIVEQNLAVSVLPELFLRTYRGDCLQLPLMQPIERHLGIRIPSLKEASPATRLFIQYLQKTVTMIESAAPGSAARSIAPVQR